jgi:hypothetical protein
MNRPLPQWPCSDCGIWQLIIPNATRTIIEWTLAGPVYQVETECPDCDHQQMMFVERHVATEVVIAMSQFSDDRKSLERRFHEVLRGGGAL